jgi:hypothetical protein
MNHGDNPSRGRGLALAACSFLIMATILGLASDETSQLFGRHFQLGQRAIASAAVVVETATPASLRSQNFPMMLTIPFAVTRTQQIMVARLKQRAQFAQRISRARGRVKTAPGLIAGLALIGASQNGNR